MRKTLPKERREDSMPVQSLGYQVRRCHRQFDRLLSTVLSEHDIKAGYWYYLRVLWDKDDLTQKQLSKLTTVAENTTAAMINGMVAAGLITRSRDQTDRRRVSIKLTSYGSSLRDKLMPYAHGVNELAAEGISGEEIAQCLSVLERVSLNLGAAFEGYAKGD